jgi:hypothetical protein
MRVILRKKMRGGAGTTFVRVILQYDILIKLRKTIYKGVEKYFIEFKCEGCADVKDEEK